MLSTRTEKSRFALIAVLMLVVLLAATGAAWLLVARRGQTAETGAEIVAALRQRTLAEHWKAPRIQWYLRTLEGSPVGWHVSVVRPASPLYHGIEMTHLGNGRGRSQTIWERWQLNADLTEGAYRAGAFSAAGGLGGLALDTMITLQDGMVSVQQGGTHMLASRSPAPPNYLPEGTLHLACLMTGKAGATAHFKMVFNERPPIDDQIDFGTLAVQHVPARSLRVAGVATAVSVKAWIGKRQDMTLLFDQSDQWIGTIYPDGLLQMAATEQQVTKIFPDAAQIAAFIAHSQKLPLRPGPAPRQPRALKPQVEDDTDVEATP